MSGEASLLCLKIATFLLGPQMASSLCHLERGLWCLFFFYKENQSYKIRAPTL